MDMKVRKRDNRLGGLDDAALHLPLRLKPGSQAPRGTHFGRLDH